MIEKYIMYLLISAVIICYIFYNNFFSNFFKIYDFSDNKRKIHKNNIPITGGIFIYLNILILYIFRKSIYTLFPESNFFILQKNELFFILLTILFLIGLIDDKISLSSNIKFVLLSFFVFLILLNYEQYLIHFIKFRNLDLEFNIFSLRYFFTVLCFLCFINAINMFDGINAQAALYFIFLSLYLLMISEQNILIFFLIILLVIFLIQNLKNNSFLGDGGIFLLSSIYAFLIIENYKMNNLYVDQIFLIMLVPGLDMIRLFFQRIKNKKNPFKADNLHIHHFLLKKYSYKSTVIIIFFLVFIPNSLALYFENYVFFIILTTMIYFYLLIRLNVFKK